MSPRWRKALRDIFERPGRSILAVVAMSAGVFGLGAIVFKYAILHPVLNTMYGNTRPASAILFTGGADDALIDSVRRLPGVADAEVRPVILARARIGEEEWVPAIVYVLRDFDRQRMDYVKPNDGAWPPAEGEILLERTAVQVAKVERGQTLVLKTPGGDEQSFEFAGTVYAAGLAPAWMEHVVYGFVAWNSQIRSPLESTQIRILTDHPLDEGYVEEVAGGVRTWLEDHGLEVIRVDVPTPGRHPHADQMDTFTYLLGAFGLLSFLLSTVLVASMTHSVLGEQVREVGIMKAIGASSRQIAGVYLCQVALLALASLVVGIPLAWLGGRAYAAFSAGILNADVSRVPFPWWVLGVEIVAGLLVPLLVALGPIARASHITVHRALSEDFAPRAFGSGWAERALAAMKWLPRPWMLSLRTTFLRRGRLALTVANLAMGGAVFISALNVAGAWNRSVMENFRVRNYDVTVSLAAPQPISTFAESLLALPGVSGAEYWPQASPYLMDSEDVPGHRLSLLGLPPDSELLDLPVTTGRWLRPADSTAVVVNSAVIARNPALRTGDEIRLRLEGRTLAYPIVGVVKELTPAPVVYAPAEAVLAATGGPAGLARTIRVVARDRSDAGQRAVAAELERLFQRRGLDVAAVTRMNDVRQSILDHILILITALMMSAAIVVFVGSLGLTSTLTLNVLQRTREIGILGAIGATPRSIAGQVWFESLAIGLISWVFANLLAAPVSFVLEAVTGRMFFRAPLDWFLSPAAAAAWLGLVVVLSSSSSLYPAWRATRLTVREAIAHI